VDASADGQSSAHEPAGPDAGEGGSAGLDTAAPEAQDATAADVEPGSAEPDGTEPSSRSADVRTAGSPDNAAGEDESTPLARELTEITRRRRMLASQKLPLPDATRVFTVANQKGGVGKTTSTVNLAAALARHGARVLVIDLDPQGNASTALGVEHRADTPSVYDVIVGDEPMASAVQRSPEFGDLYCLPATIHLAGAEIELVSLVAREQRLRSALEAFLAESPDPFHYVFIDCPPSLGLLTINAFVAAREVIIPIQCEYYALEGLSQLLANIQLIEKHLNPVLSVSTILLTMYDSRTNLANQVAQEVREHFPDKVLSTLIPRSVRISEAPSYGQSVISYDGSSSGSLSYLEAAAEIARRGAVE
jgi:chromosome partitioning protein